MAPVGVLPDLADTRRASVAQIATAWVAAQGKDIFPSSGRGAANAWRRCWALPRSS